MTYLRVHGRFHDFMHQEGRYPNIRILEHCQSLECSLAKVSSLLSLLSFLMVANSIFDDIATYSVPGSSLKKPALKIKGQDKTRENRKSASRPASWKFQES